MKTGRCVKALDAHDHFVTCMAWGRATAGGGPPTTNEDPAKLGVAAVNPKSRVVTVMATGSVDQSVKIWSP